MSPPGTGRRIGAFFDFDHTVIDTAGGSRFGAELLRLRWRRTLDDRPGTVGWAARLAKESGRVGYLAVLYAGLTGLNAARAVKRSTMVRIGYRNMRGWPSGDLDELARDYFDEVLAPRIYPQARAAMAEHRRLGHVVVVATTNMRLLVEHLSRHAPVDHVLGVEFETLNGLLTGQVEGPLWGQDKAKEVRRWAHVNNVSLPLSHGYSDHYSDHPFLRLFGHPHVVNADRRLLRLARSRGWIEHRFNARDSLS